MTDIKDKIKRKIEATQILNGEIIKEIYITKEEAELLGDIRAINNVKLIIEGNKTKKDCFAYIKNNGHESCYGLNKLYCKNKKCKFYKKDITKEKIEKDLEKYAKGKKMKGVSLR